ncbi:MAG TPA: chloride channel protein [Polyangiaceae bacterium]|jgi:CIC family chloride channel protein|nr:chloride channel protein [Polyangiaceae bacterium]
MNLRLKLETWLRSLRLRLLKAELRFAPTETQRLFALTIAIGVVCGFAAVAFHFAISIGERLMFNRAINAPGDSFIAWSIISPAVGGLVSGLLLEFVFPNARGSGIPQVKVAYASRDGVVRLRDAIGKFFLSGIQIGSGGSLGREGPTVQICCGVASALGRLGRLSPKNRRRLLPVGAAAGIAAAFNAPIAAVTFTIEEVVGNLDQTVLSGVIVAAALAAVIERSVLGAHPIFDVKQTYGLVDARSLVLYAALGVAAAFVSICFTDGLLLVRKRFRGQTRIPVWAQPAVGGAVTGAIAAAVMAWFHMGGINGGGYAVLDQALTASLTVKVMLVLCAMKLVATVCSYASGGAGGIFAPALFMGAMLGGAFGSLDRTIFHHPDSTLGAFALVGMGATFGGTIRAPMTSVLIIVELTSGYGLILPLMIANTAAYVIASRLRPAAIYEALLAQDGIHLRDSGPLVALESMKLDAFAMKEGSSKVRFRFASRGGDLLRQTEGLEQRVFPVVDAEDRMVGVVTGEELALLEADSALALLVTASEIMRAPISVHSDDNLLTALELMRSERLPELPIIDREGHVLGFIDEATIAQAYLRETAPKTAATAH